MTEQHQPAKLSLDDLGGISRTLLIPLYFRALEFRQPDPLLQDEKAAGLVERLDVDFGFARKLAGDRASILLRARQFDRWTRDFLVRHPAGGVVELGCGFDTRYYRVDNGLLDWYDLDLPGVIRQRRVLLPEPPRCRYIASSVLELAWMDQLRPRPGQAFLFLAEGLLPYLEEDQVRRLAAALRERFPGGELVTDAMTRLLVQLHNLELGARGMDFRLHWGVRDAREMERWDVSLRLVESWTYFDEPNQRLGVDRIWRFVPPLGCGAMILRYRFED